MEYKDLKELIFEKVKTKYGDKGYLTSEVEDLKDLLKSQNPSFSEEKMNSSFFGNTAHLINGEIVNYKHDVLLAMRCGLENRDETIFEFD